MRSASRHPSSCDKPQELFQTKNRWSVSSPLSSFSSLTSRKSILEITDRSSEATLCWQKYWDILCPRARPVGFWQRPPSDCQISRKKREHQSHENCHFEVSQSSGRHSSTHLFRPLGVWADCTYSKWRISTFSLHWPRRSMTIENSTRRGSHPENGTEDHESTKTDSPSNRSTSALLCFVTICSLPLEIGEQLELLILCRQFSHNLKTISSVAHLTAH